LWGLNNIKPTIKISKGCLLLLKIGGATMDFCNHMKPYESQIQEMVKKCLGEKK
jgi:hypothetical protein